MNSPGSDTMNVEDYLEVLEDKLSERPERQEKSKEADVEGIGLQGADCCVPAKN